jgi:hypothetical protein
VRVEERWDVAGDGGRLTNDYYLLEHREEGPGRIDAPPPSRTGAASPSRTDAAPPGRTGAAPPAARMRPLREREPGEREPGVNERPPSLPPQGRGGRLVLDLTTRPKPRDAGADDGSAHGEAVAREPTQAAALLPRPAGPRQPPSGRPCDPLSGRRRIAPTVNPVDARILASIRRSEQVG